VVHLDHPEHGALAACTARDTTERRSLEHDLLAKHASLIAAHGELERTVGELRRTQAMLEDRTREIAAMAGQVAQFGWRAAVGEMCATIAHNLNNPVAALQSTLRTIERRAGDQADAAALTPLVARASSAATRIQEHVAAVVNVHRVGSLDVAPRRLDLARELETALALIAGRTSTIDIRRRFAGPVVALAPQDPLQHVLGIVLDNAVKAMPTGGVLDLAIEAQGGRAVVAVADDGVGLPPHIAARLFEPIVTARPTGAGLGLATAQRLARSWGGDIAYRPRPRGACFEISVPAKES
jgi:signal transduction histidine kinase